MPVYAALPLKSIKLTIQIVNLTHSVSEFLLFLMPLSFSTKSNDTLNRYGRPDGPSTKYDIDGHDIRPKPKPNGKPYVSVPSIYEPKVGYN